MIGNAPAIEGSGLAAALGRFNQAFDYSFVLPMCREDLLAAAELARLRGRNDICHEIRVAGNYPCECDICREGRMRLAGNVICRDGAGKLEAVV